MTCDICEGAIMGKPLHPIYNKSKLVMKVCNYCYRGLYGFRYHSPYLRKAADIIDNEEGANFLDRRLSRSVHL